MDVPRRVSKFRPDSRPSTDDERSTIRSDQVKRTLERIEKQKALSGRCVGCGLLQQPPRVTCICGAGGVLKPLPSRHSVTTIIHPCELARVSSTHILLKLGLAKSATCVWNTEQWPDVASVWQHVRQECEATGQAPAFLYPSPHAVHVADYYRSLPPAQRRAGLSLVVLDGTWSNAKCIAKELPGLLEAHRTMSASGGSGGSTSRFVPAPVAVYVTPRQPFTLFHPLRRQPSPGRVSTVEAVALVFDDVAAVEASLAHPQLDVGEHQSAVGRRPVVWPHDLLGNHGSLDGHATRLRLYLMTLVDAITAQNGELGPTRRELSVSGAPQPPVLLPDGCKRAKFRGVGYRTWTIGGAQPPVDEARYRRLLADAQPRSWWQRRTEESRKEGIVFASAEDRAKSKAGDGSAGNLASAFDALAVSPSAPVVRAPSVRSWATNTFPLPSDASSPGGVGPWAYTGMFTGLPAWVVAHIAEFAYGVLDVDAPTQHRSDSCTSVPSTSGGRIIPCGYRVRLSRDRRSLWAAYEAKHSGGGATTHTPVIDDDNDEDETAGIHTDDDGGDSSDEDDDEEEIQSNEQSAVSGATPTLSRLDFKPRNSAQLPQIGRHNSHPLALSCRELLILFSGRIGPASGWGRPPPSTPQASRAGGKL